VVPRRLTTKPLTGRARRPLPTGLGAPSNDPEAPLTPAPAVPWLQPFPDARMDIDVRADIRLALVAALQALPARQRAVLVLRQVLEFSAAEVAVQLDMSVPAVNSALARATLPRTGGLGDVREPDDAEERRQAGEGDDEATDHPRQPTMSTPASARGCESYRTVPRSP
jgi:RNA polymerase sigma-70 factor (ECF subfamily)